MAERTYQERAEAELKRLRGLFKQGNVPGDDEAALRLQAANVLATLALADAIRGRNGQD